MEDILEEANVFIFEGHDTTASAISWSLFLLSQQPEHMAKCYEEIREIFDYQNGGKYVTQQQINELTHFSMCIKECLRLKSPVPMIGRQLHNDVYVGEFWYKIANMGDEISINERNFLKHQRKIRYSIIYVDMRF
jgi:cytochrome P450